MIAYARPRWGTPLGNLLSKLDPRADVRGRQFERICKWYLQSAPEYRRKFRNVWLWSDWPDAWAADAGIDLVAEEHDGDLWVVQAKAYDQSYAIKKADVDSFLSEAGRPQFSYRLLIAAQEVFVPYWATFENFHVEIKDVIHADNEQVVTAVLDRGRMKGSDAEVWNDFFHVWTFRDGKVARLSIHTRRSRALKAAGLSE